MNLLTVVFEIPEDCEGNPAKEFQFDTPYKGMNVIGLSRYDEISRVEYLEGLLDKHWIEYDQPEAE